MSTLKFIPYVMCSLLVVRTGHAEIGGSIPEELSTPDAASAIPSDTTEVDAEAPSAKGVSLLLEPGLAMAPDYDGSRNYELVPLWRVRANNLYHPSTFIEINGANLRSNLLPDEHFRIGPSATYVPARRNVQNERVDALGDTGAGVLFGGVVGYEQIVPWLGIFGAEVDARYDVAGKIGGLVTLRGTYAIPVAGGVCVLALLPELTYASAEYMHELFAVDDAASARSGLARYEPGAGFKDAAIAAVVSYRLNERLQLEGIGRYARLMGDAADSPVVTDVGDENQFVSGLLAGYQF